MNQVFYILRIYFCFLLLFQIANIYFDASLQCGDHCYVGLPFVLKCMLSF